MKVFTFFERRWRKSLKKNRGGDQRYIFFFLLDISLIDFVISPAARSSRSPVSAAVAGNYSGGLLFNFFVLFVIVSHPHNKLLERNLKEDFFPQFDFCIVLQLKSQSSDLSDWTLISTYGSTLCSTSIFLSLSLSMCVYIDFTLRRI